MKKILISLALLALPTIVRAQNNVLVNGAAPASVQSQNVNSVLRSSITCAQVAISNSAGTDIIGSTSTAHSFVTVEDISGTANLFCSENKNVATSGALTGFKITPGQTVTFTLPVWIKFYCINDTGGSVNVVACKGW